MVQQQPIAEENLPKSRTSEAGVQPSRLAASKLDHPRSNPTVSGMWAASVLWAAEGLADLVSATLRTVTSAQSDASASQQASAQWRYR